MPFCELHYFSDALAKQTSANLILPSPNLKPPYHVMFLLHGLSDNHTMWTRRTSIERYVENLPLIVVMPDGGRSFYLDPAERGPRYGSAIGIELPEIIRNYFKTTDRWAITGLSMGGYGALKLAGTHPDTFQSAVSHSGAVQFGHYEQDRRDDFELEFRPVLGTDFVGGSADLFKLLPALPEGKRPKVRIDCGIGDFLIEANRDLHQHLLAQGFEHEYAEFPGEHNWEYWDEHVREAIDFHGRNLGFLPGS
jgi:S-formylglutathione hydrolase FrmB